MKTVYRVLAYLVAAEVAVQAMAMVFAIAGLGKWVDSGGVFDKSVMESDQSPFPQIIGFMVHGLNGTIVIPALALLLVIGSFFAKIPRGVRWAALVLLLVVVQVNLGYAGHDIPALGGFTFGITLYGLFLSALGVALWTQPTPSTQRPRSEAVQVRL